MNFSNKLLYILIILYILGTWGIAFSYGITDRFSLLIYARPVVTTTALILSLFMGWLCFYTMIKIRPQKLTLYLINDLKTRWLTKQRLLQSVPLLVLFLFFIAAFSSMKSAIPVIQPYNWDPIFYELDHMLHSDIDPWKLLQPVLGYPPITFVINVVYNLWFPVIFAVLYWQAFTVFRPELRQRFLLSFFLCWIINGTVLAILFSSAGPCFYGRLFPDTTDPYASLMTYLHMVQDHFPVWALETQNMLWNIYEKNSLSFGSGISAMPSLHVSIAWLLLLFGRHINKFWEATFFIFFIFIMVGSVHLAWHYAVDGYLAIITTSLIWLITGGLYADRSDDHANENVRITH